MKSGGRGFLHFIAAVLVSPVLVAAFRACVEMLRNPDLKTRIFGHGEPMLFFFAGLGLYVLLHLMLPSAVRKTMVENEPGISFWKRMTGGEESVWASALSMAFPVLCIGAVILYFAVGVAWKDIADYFPLLMFLLGLTFCFHLLCGLERLFASGPHHIGTALLSAVLAVVLALEFLMGMLALVSGKIDWSAYNRRVYELSAGTYSSLWHQLKSLFPAGEGE